MKIAVIGIALVATARAGWRLVEDYKQKKYIEERISQDIAVRVRENNELALDIEAEIKRIDQPLHSLARSQTTSVQKDELKVIVDIVEASHETAARVGRDLAFNACRSPKFRRFVEKKGSLTFDVRHDKSVISSVKVSDCPPESDLLYKRTPTFSIQR